MSADLTARLRDVVGSRRTAPLGSVPAFVAARDRALQEALPGIRLVTYGHVGDGTRTTT